MQQRSYKNEPVLALLWDIDGTVLDYSPRQKTFTDRALEQADIDPKLAGPLARRAAGEIVGAGQRVWKTREEERDGFLRAARALMGEIPSTPGQAARLAKALEDYYDTYAPIAGLVDILAAVQAHGVKQAVVSNWPPSLRVCLDFHDLTRYFAVIVCSAEEGIRKPEPAMFMRALEALHVNAEQAVFVGNSLTSDIEPSRRLGMRTIHFDPRGEYDTADARTSEDLLAHLRMFLPI